MKLSNANWVAALLTAVAKGGTLQYRDAHQSPWKDLGSTDHVSFSQGEENYRVRLQPREIYIPVSENGELSYTYSKSRTAAEEYFPSGQPPVKFVEVIE